MSDSATAFAPAPRTGLAGPDLASLAETYRTGRGAFLAAQVQQGFGNTLAGLGLLEGRAQTAELLAADDDLRPLSREDWQAGPYAREQLTWQPGWTAARARAMADIHDERQARQALIARRDAGWLDTGLGFGAGLIGALPTPENFVPFGGPALAAARAQTFWRGLRAGAANIEAMQAGTIGARATAGALTGAIDGFAGNLLAMPMTVPLREQFGDDVTWAEIVQDLAFGAAGGALLGSAFGAALGRPQAAPDGRPLPPYRTTSQTAQDGALRTLAGGADQMAAGQDVNLALLAPEARAELLAARAELERLRQYVPPEATGTGGRAERAAARPLQATGQARPGAEARVTTPAGTEATVRFEVVEAADLITSNTLPDFQVNPDFDPALQPRDRGQAEAQAQVRRIASELRPEEVEASTLATTGAPIVGPDGMVESGNGRALAIRLAYAEGMPTAQAYRAFLLQAGFRNAEGMQAPVLIRRRVSQLDTATRRRFVDESNSDTIKRLSPSEQAAVDARRLDTGLLAQLRPAAIDGADNAGFVRGFINGLPPTEQGALSSGGALTPDGLARVQRALASRAYGDAQLLARLTESRDGAAETLGRALIDAAPAIARLRGAIEGGQVRPELDATAALVRAVQRIQAARDANLPMRSVLDQLDMFDTSHSPAERAMLELLLRHPVREAVGGVGRETLAARLESYVRHAMEAATTPDAFGMPPPGLGDVLRAAFREAGLEAPTALRGLEADAWTPAPEALPEPPAPQTTRADPVAAAAAERGLDVEATAAIAEAQRLAEAGTLPPELAAALAEADAAARAVAQPEAFDAAMACVIRG